MSASGPRVLSVSWSKIQIVPTTQIASVSLRSSSRDKGLAERAVEDRASLVFRPLVERSLGDLTVVASANPGHRDLCAMAQLRSTLLAILGLQQAVMARKDDADERSLALVLKSGAAVSVRAAIWLGTSYGIIERLHETDPASWTPAAVDALEAGMEVES